jgi:hypothetical protein
MPFIERPTSRVVLFTLLEEAVGMRFVVNYEGPLAANDNPKQKHAIRRCLLPQLKAQWQIDPALSVTVRRSKLLARGETMAA